MRRTSPRGILVAASCSAMVALGLMMWSLVVPTPMPVLVAMSVGQVLGTLSLLAYLAVVLLDVRKAHLERELRPTSAAPPSPER